jgi:hypothetical protein
MTSAPARSLQPLTSIERPDLFCRMLHEPSAAGSIRQNWQSAESFGVIGTTGDPLLPGQPVTSTFFCEFGS